MQIIKIVPPELKDIVFMSGGLVGGYTGIELGKISTLILCYVGRTFQFDILDDMLGFGYFCFDKLDA